MLNSSRMIRGLVVLVVVCAGATVAKTKPEKIDALMRKYLEYGQFNGAVLVAESGNVILKKRASGYERAMYMLGYQLLQQGKAKAAIEVFKLNVDTYPKSWNVYDSLGEACMNDGQTALAIKNYQTSIELNPGNVNGAEILKKLKGEK